MSKKYKGKPCVYCAERESTTADHVICREFFPVDRRDGIPQAPACRDCNVEKSKLEHYLTSLLPFGARDEAGARMLREKVSRRLDKNERLRRDLQEGVRPAYVEKDGVVRPSSSVPIDGERFFELCCFIIRGLVWCEWDHVVPQGYVVRAVGATEVGRVLFQRLLGMSPNLQVSRSVGGGAFEYRCTRSPEDAGFSVWKISFYGGINMAGSDENGRLLPLETYGFTGPSEVEEMFDEVVRETGRSTTEKT